jgi:hypothetical protein
MSLLVVNMVPQALSGETNSDSEPFIAVNPANPNQIAASAFTPDPIPNPAMFPIYISSDGGQTWTLHSVVPISSGDGIPLDITLRFSPSTNNLYAAVLTNGGVQVLRSSDYPALLQPMTVIHSTPSGDQPYIEAATVPAGTSAGPDRIYVGRGHASDAPGQSDLAIDFSLDAGAANPAFSTAYPQLTTGVAGYEWQIRPAVHPDGTVYALFYDWIGKSDGLRLANVVVVRDDEGGVGFNPQAGRNVTPMPITYPDGGELAQERLGGELAIAVDPRNSAVVYVAWADRQGTGPYTLHVSGSFNAGVDWSGDLRTIPSAQNPALAVNSRGKVAFLYQQVTEAPEGQRWETHLERSVDAVGWQDMLLASMPADAPAGDSLVGTYLGDYLSLMAVGKNFYGVFCMSNLPDFENYLANFPQGVVYQRNTDFDSQPHVLLDVDGATPVPSSIDPFFVKVTELEPELDVYVRDWTENAQTHDIGVEPSTHGDFFTTSDVWNQQTSDTPLPFDSDQPPHEPPQPSVLGDNFAFLRVSRNATNNTPSHVDAQFLYADFGLAPFATLPGGGAVSVDLGPDELSQTLSVGQKWQLPALASPHVAMAVQISTPDDPMLGPGLVGTYPGASTDVSTRLDNNKAFRNVAVYQVIRGLGQFFYAVAHCRPPCDLHVLLDLGGPVEENDGYVEVIDGLRDPLHYPLRPGQVLDLERMRPAENRWIGVAVTAGAEPVRATFTALRRHVSVAGFSIVAQPAALATVLQSNLRFQAALWSRLAALQIPGAGAESEATVELLRIGKLSDAEYVKYLRTHAERVRRQVSEVFEREQAASARTPRRLHDPFDVLGALARFDEAVRSGDPEHAAGVHGPLLHKLDAFLTMLSKFPNDAAT